MKLLPKNIIRDAVKLGDLLSTVGGGISQTEVKVTEFENRATIRISAPGVQPESFMVILHQNKLTVFSEYHRKGNEALKVPLFQRIWELPPHVNVSGIEAVYENGALRIHLPFHDSLNQPRQIRIRHLE